MSWKTKAFGAQSVITIFNEKDAIQNDNGIQSLSDHFLTPETEIQLLKAIYIAHGIGS